MLLFFSLSFSFIPLPVRIGTSGRGEGIVYSTSRRFPIRLSKHRPVLTSIAIIAVISAASRSSPHLPFPLLDFMYAYAQIAEADRGGFDCTARDRRFINPLSARLSLPLTCAYINLTERGKIVYLGGNKFFTFSLAKNTVNKLLRVTGHRTCMLHFCHQMLPLIFYKSL